MYRTVPQSASRAQKTAISMGLCALAASITAEESAPEVPAVDQAPPAVEKDVNEQTTSEVPLVPVLAEETAIQADEVPPAPEGSVPPSVTTGDPAGSEGRAVPDAPIPPTKSGAGSTTSLYALGRVRFGYDTNVLAVPDDIDTNTEEESGLVSGRVDFGARWKQGKHRLRIGLSADATHYFDTEDFDQTRFGVNLGYQHVDGSSITHAQSYFNNFHVDGEAVLDDIGLNAGMAHILKLKGQKVVTIASVTINAQAYDLTPDQDGYGVSGKVGAWLVFGPTSKRLELDVKIGRYKADENYESYWTVRPGATLRWNWKEGLMKKPLKVSAYTRFEIRGYNETLPSLLDDPNAESEESDTLNFGGDVYWSWTDHVAVGFYAQYTERTSNLTFREYDRFRYGIEARLKW